MVKNVASSMVHGALEVSAVEIAVLRSLSLKGWNCEVFDTFRTAGGLLTGLG